MRYSLGSSLIELLMATAVAAIVLTAVATSMIFSLKNAAQARYRDTATTLAQDVVEFFRRERAELGWGVFVNALDAQTEVCVTGTLTDETTLTDFVDGPCVTIESIGGASFKRDVTILYPDDDTVRIMVSVSWLTGEADWQSVSIDQVLTKWN